MCAYLYRLFLKQLISFQIKLGVLKYLNKYLVNVMND